MSQQPQGPSIRTIVVIVFVLLAILTVAKSYYIVRPDQFVVVTKFGEPIDEKRDPGLYFLIPYVQEARYLDSRVRGWDDIGKETKTAELNPIDFVVFARWRIDSTEQGPTRYYKAVGTDKRAHASMDSIVTARIQASVREHKLASIVRDTGRNFEARAALDLSNLFEDYDECKPERSPEIKRMLREYDTKLKSSGTVTNVDAKALRTTIVTSILENANATLVEQFGIQILDLHFKYLNYSPQVHHKIIEKISADRGKDIASYTKVGKTCTGIIDRTKEQQTGEIIGSRDRTVRLLEGQAVAKAIMIKAHAFNKSPEFFQFIKTLELYEHGLTQRTDLILSADSPLLNLMTDAQILQPVAKINLPPLSEEDESAKVPTPDSSASEKPEAKTDNADAPPLDKPEEPEKPAVPAPVAPTPTP
jgi:membrane protease subunit HflC